MNPWEMPFGLGLAAVLVAVAGYYALSRNGRARIRRRHVNARFLATGTTAPVIAVNPVPWRRLLITALCGAAALAVLPRT